MKVFATMKIAMQQDLRLEEISKVWQEMYKYSLHATVKKGSYSQREIQKAVYTELNTFNEYQKHHSLTAMKTACETVKGSMALLKKGYRARFPSAGEDFVVLCKGTVSINRENCTISIAYKPNNRLVLELFPSTEQRERLKTAKFKGFKLVKRDGQWFFYVSEIREVVLPHWNTCETVVGVDIGINFLAVASALTPKGFSNPLFIKGGEYKHLQLQKRSKVAVMQSKGIKTTEKWNYYNRRLSEILHTTAKRIVEYAKTFPKPLIVLEDLSSMPRKQGHNRKMNFLLNDWQRTKLQSYIEYKANWLGIPVAKVFPRGTSHVCHLCGSEGERQGLVFRCSSCGRTYNSDANASMNIASRFANNVKHLLAIRGIPNGLSSVGKSGASKLQTVSELAMTDEKNGVSLS